MIHARENLDQVVSLISDFNNFDERIATINKSLDDESFPENVNLLSFFKKIKVMQFVKNKLQRNPELDEL